MKVILTQDVANCGRKNEQVEVADGYAMNYLLPRSLAKVATDDNLAQLEAWRSQEAERQQALDAQLESGLQTIADTTVTIKRKANNQGHLFAGVSAEEVVQELDQIVGLELERRHILLDQPIKELGDHQVRVRVGDKEADFTLSVQSE